MRIFASDTPICCAITFWPASSCGTNSCSGGSSRRIVTGRPLISRNMPSKSPRCIGSSLASALRRPASSSARIISRTALMRSPSKNMCSVRHRPMPVAPKLRATLASSGVSALVRTSSRLYLSASAISLPKSPLSSASLVAILPAKTSPVEPLSEIHSPSA